MRLNGLEVSEDFKNLNADALSGLTVASKDLKGSKYHNTRTEAEGRTFMSGIEAKRAVDLRLLQKGGQIFGLTYQVKFLLYGGVSYIADFVYLELVDGKLQPVVEDAKGFKTREYLNKKKQFKAKYGIEIRES